MTRTEQIKTQLDALEDIHQWMISRYGDKALETDIGYGLASYIDSKAAGLRVQLKLIGRADSAQAATPEDPPRANWFQRKMETVR